MNKLKARILRTLKSLPTRAVYDPPPTRATATATATEKRHQQQQTPDADADADADDLFFFDAPPSPDSILNPKPDPSSPSSSSSSSSSYVLVHLPDSPQSIAAADAQTNPNSRNDDEDDDDGEGEGDEEEEEELLLRGFEVRCPPGGEEAVIVYTTSLRGIRKTFEDCGRVRLLLQSLGAAFHERDVAMDAGYRDELRAVLAPGAAPPRVFVKGRYVGGAEEVVALHERGELLPLLRSGRRRRRRRGGGGVGGGLCAGCGGAGFVVCARCSGSCKVYYDEAARGPAIRCPNCNENGLAACPLCLFAAAD